MSDNEFRILLVEDVPADAELALRELKKAGMTCKTVRAETRTDYLRHLDGFAPDIILSDFSLPHFDGMSALALAREKCPEVPFIFVSGTIGEEIAIKSLKSGATDYILKTNLARLAPAVQRALQDALDSKAHQEAERQVHQLQERFELFMRYLPGVAFIKDLQGRYQFVNKTWEQVTGVKSGTAKGLTDSDLWPELAKQYQQSEQAVLERNEVVEALNEFPMDDGLHTFLVHRFPMLDVTGRLAMIGGVAIDLTERLRAEEKISRLSRIRTLLSSINAAIVRMRDRDELYREVCRIAVYDGGFKLAWVGLLDPETLDIRPVAWVGEDGGLLDHMRLSAREDRPGGRGVSGSAIRKKELMVVNDVANDERLAHREETQRSGFRSFVVLPLLVETQPVGSLYFYTTDEGFFDQEEIRLLAELAGDISFALEHIEKSEKLDYLAYYDGLTGLANRQLFFDRVNQLLQSAHRDQGQVALVLVDLRRFGLINNTLGRQAGDAVLKQVGERFKNALQDLYPLARISDNLFAIALADASEAAKIAHVLEGKVLASLNQPFLVEGQELKLSAKCGVAIFPGDGPDVDTLFRNAEAAVKNAKNKDEPYVFYAPQMNARVAEQLRLENDLRDAIRKEQFILHYQPRVTLATGRVEGVEALVRWMHPERGLVPPGEFIPLLEDTGMILEVGYWALTHAAEDYTAWCAQGLTPPRIAVNVSAVQLRQKDFVERVKMAVAAGGGCTERIDIELTESILMGDIESNVEKLRAIRATGMKIAIDDFGTGYSSLSYLARLPIDALKIDRSFVLRMNDSPENLSIVSTVISLAHSLNLKVTAEGVETIEQQNLLRLLKCDEMQGYLFSWPLPAEEVVTKFCGAESEPG